MALSRDDVLEVLHAYITAWETQDPDLILTIFTERASYHERVMGEPMCGREAIRQYWESKVVGAQANISCTLLTLVIDSDADTAVAEWLAEFDDTVQGVRKRMREIARLEFEGGKIASLREYWASETVGSLVAE